MFFDDLGKIPELATGTNFAIFVVNPKTNINLKNAFTITIPEKKTQISINQIREVEDLVKMKQTSERYIVITPADAMGIDAQNAFLKNLEEPKEHYHFVLLTDKPNLLLPTVLSRGQLYILKKDNSLDEPPKVDKKVLDLAKRLISAKPEELPKIATDITSHKDNTRTYALLVIGTAIEILYKSYFATKQIKFVARIPKFLTLYQNIEMNGHIKLHLVADML